jgi:hypothetical protein
MNRWIYCCAACLAVCAAGLAADAPGERDEPFKAIPPADLNRQVDLYLQGFATALADSGKYEEVSRRVMKDAHTLAAIALVLAKHESDHPRKRSAPALLSAAQRLASATDYPSARSALAAVQAAAKGGGNPAETSPKWGTVAPQGQLMKQVTFVNNRLRRNMRRLEEKADDIALDAAVLSVIAQAVTHDYSAVKDPQQSAKWVEFCNTMRDTAGELNAQVHQKNREGADAALGRMTKNCEQCHAIFRKQLLPTKE